MKKLFLIAFSFVPVLFFAARYYLSHNTLYLCLFALFLLVNGILILFLKKKLLIQYWFGLAFSAMFIDIIFTKIELGSFVASIKNINVVPLFGASLLILLSSVVQTFRWKVILGREKALNFSDLYPSVMIGHLFNHILPAKGGELVRTYHFGNAFGVSKLSTLSTLLIERIFDGLMALSFLFFFLLFLKKGYSDLSFMGIGGLVIYGGAFLAAFLFFKFNDGFSALLKKIFPGVSSEKLLKHVKSFSEGLKILNNPKSLASVTFLSLIMWVIIALSIVPIMRLFDFNLPFYASFCILACICLGMTLPSAPGGIGIISIATVFAVGLIYKGMGVGIDSVLYSKIVLFSLLINIVMVLPEVIVGLFFAFRTGIKQLKFIEEI
ncbi:MAG: lysylphosphatidylglycerol synthase transmembrane domain-containing protein [Elusimicrobiota bacterium]